VNRLQHMYTTYEGSIMFTIVSSNGGRIGLHYIEEYNERFQVKTLKLYIIIPPEGMIRNKLNQELYRSLTDSFIMNSIHEITEDDSRWYSASYISNKLTELGILPYESTNTVSIAKSNIMIGFKRNGNRI
jgi:hypothetical protein